MTLDSGIRESAMDLLIEKANRNMDQARLNAEHGYWDCVANRLYYSIFHAVNAIMMRDGIKCSTHKGVSSQFGLHYVKTGKFDTEDGYIYSRLQTMREKADYDNVFKMTEEEGKIWIEKSVKLLDKLKSYYDTIKS